MEVPLRVGSCQSPLLALNDRSWSKTVAQAPNGIGKSGRLTAALMTVELVSRSFNQPFFGDLLQNLQCFERTIIDATRIQAHALLEGISLHGSEGAKEFQEKSTDEN